MAGEANYTVVTRPNPAALVEMYRDLEADLFDFRKVWPRLAPVLGRALGANIDNQGSALGESWPDLSRPYALRKARAGAPGRPLVLTGETRRALSKGTVVSSGKTFLSVGLRGKKWARNPALNFGSGALPRRAYMGFTPAMIADTERMMGEHTQGVLDKAADRFNRSGK